MSLTAALTTFVNLFSCSATVEKLVSWNLFSEGEDVFKLQRRLYFCGIRQISLKTRSLARLRIKVLMDQSICTWSDLIWNETCFLHTQRGSCVIFFSSEGAAVWMETFSVLMAREGLFISIPNFSTVISGVWSSRREVAFVLFGLVLSSKRFACLETVTILGEFSPWKRHQHQRTRWKINGRSPWQPIITTWHHPFHTSYWLTKHWAHQLLLQCMLVDIISYISQCSVLLHPPPNLLSNAVSGYMLPW